MSDTKVEVGSVWVRKDDGRMFRVTRAPFGSHGWVMLRSWDTDRLREISLAGLLKKYLPASPDSRPEETT